MHQIEYYTVDKRKEIMKVASEFAFYNTDRGENPTGSYHGNMTIHDKSICESYEEAKERIEEWDTGWYSDHAVQYKDKSNLKPTKQMETLQARAKKLIDDKNEFIDAHSVRNRKSGLIGCGKCGSKIAKSYMRTDRCPVCGTDMRPEYVIERIRKYEADHKAIMKQIEELRRKQNGKCPVRWLVKVEVHC